MNDVTLRIPIDPHGVSRMILVSHCCFSTAKFATLKNKFWFECSYCDCRCEAIIMEEIMAMSKHREIIARLHDWNFGPIEEMMTHPVETVGVYQYSPDAIFTTNTTDENPPVF